MSRTNDFYTNETTFLRSVAEEKLKRRNLGTLWLTAAGSAWPIAAMSILKAAMVKRDENSSDPKVIDLDESHGTNEVNAGAMAGGLALGVAPFVGFSFLLGPIGMLTGLGVLAASRIFNEDETSIKKTKEIIKQISAAKQIFHELQSIRFSNKREFEEEIEALFNDLVENKKIGI